MPRQRGDHRRQAQHPLGDIIDFWIEFDPRAAEQWADDVRATLPAAWQERLALRAPATGGGRVLVVPEK